MNKKVFATQMSYEVTEQEKEVAEQALLVFNATKNLLNKSSDYLNIIYNPFSKSPEIDYDQIYTYRAALRRFRDKTIENFNNFKIASFKCVKLMNNFSFDTQTIKLMKSFTNSIEELESKVNDFADVFDDLKNKNFVQDIVKGVESIQSKCEEIEDLINDRIKPHIKNNILSKSWINNIGDDLEMNIEKRTPLVVELSKNRSNQ